MEYKKSYTNLNLIKTQELIRTENKHKAGIYLIQNIISNDKYVGSACSNRINVRFRNHLIHRTGNVRLAAAVKKYGIENFNFHILEYFTGFVKKENLNAAHTELLLLEAKYIEIIKPEYNIFHNTTGSLDNKHTNETKEKMCKNYSLDREDRIRQLNLGKI
jgi:group I intron endonuclease